MDNRVGIHLIAFETGPILPHQGRADLITAADPSLPPPGNGRRVRVWIERVVRAEQAFPLRFSFVEASPFLLETTASDMASR